MPLYVYNTTALPVTLAGISVTIIVPASAAPPAAGARVNVTSELRGLAGATYTALEAQRLAAGLVYEWVGDIEYACGTLTITGSVTAASLAQNSVTDAARLESYAPTGVVNICPLHASTCRTPPLATCDTNLVRLCPDP